MMYNWLSAATISGYPLKGMWGSHPWGMMGGYGYGVMGGWGQGFFALEAVLHLVTWVIVIWLLVAIARYFWKKGGK